MVRIGGLYKQQSEKGDYLSGPFVNGHRLVVLKNNHKEKDTDPDYILYIAEKQQQSEESNFDL